MRDIAEDEICISATCYSSANLISQMDVTARLRYYRRIFSSYLTHRASHLNFWHDIPRENPHAPTDRLREYYMDFFEKADYAAYLDSKGIPMLDYHGSIGLRYNPIAVAQWGLGNYNLYVKSNDAGRRQKFLAASDWLCSHLEQNSGGAWVWQHHFDWEYRTRLKAPWYSGLAQGQGISLLLRAYVDTGAESYKDAAQKAFVSFLLSTAEGGVVFEDADNHIWLEEYIVFPPTHILNGFIWAVWGVRDYFLVTNDASAKKLFDESIATLKATLDRYDCGFWSLYEQSGTTLPMIASPFYHQLHIVQLRVMFRLTGEQFFADVADRWQRYAQSRSKRARALCYKCVFKLFHY